MKRFSCFLILFLVSGCTTTSELVEDIFMPDYRRIRDGDRTYYYMHPTKPNKFSDKKKWQVYFKDEKLISSTSWKPDGQKCPETNVINGKRIRKYFKRGEKSEALRYREELFRQANEVRKQDRQLITGNLLHEAVTAHRALSPLGKTITDTVTFYSEHLIASNKQKKAPLTDAIGRFLDAKEAKNITNWQPVGLPLATDQKSGSCRV